MSHVSCVLLVLVALVFFNCCQTASVPRNFDSRFSDDMTMKKRGPFCNTYGGCGLKRSSPGMPVQELLKQRQLVEEDSIESLLEPGNAIDELSRQILSEAKLWEALQEAGVEIVRRKQREAYYN